MQIAIIVAAGSGLRMSSPLRKQYMLLAGQPILRHTLMVFSTSLHSIFLVVSQEDFDYCQKYVIPLNLQERIQLVPGGSSRQASVYNGLQACACHDPEIVIIHDGVRPLVTADQIRACLNGAVQYGACILGIPSTSTLKKVIPETAQIEKTIARQNIWLAQTPQAFSYKIILKAHQKAFESGYQGTDDAELVEKNGGKVHIISGSAVNIKITRPADLTMAEALIK